MRDGFRPLVNPPSLNSDVDLEATGDARRRFNEAYRRWQAEGVALAAGPPTFPCGSGGVNADLPPDDQAEPKPAA
jgi:hypothetical protein